MRKTLFTLLALLIMSSSFFITSAAIVIPASPHAEKPVPSAIKAAVMALKNMPGTERKQKLKQAKKEIKAFKAAKKAGKEPSTNTILLVILALLLPPLAVYLHEGEVNNKFWITLLLFVLGVAGVFLFSWLALLAAIIYALIVVLGG